MSKRRGFDPAKHFSPAIPEYVKKPYYGPPRSVDFQDAPEPAPARCPDTGELFCTCASHVPPPPEAA